MRQGSYGSLEIEATERRVIVRYSDLFAGKTERAVDFRSHIEAEGVTALLENDELKIMVPKRRVRKIKVG